MSGNVRYSSSRESIYLRASNAGEREGKSMKTMIAKYPGRCFECGKPIVPGDSIKYYGRLHCEHAKCSEASVQSDPGPDYFDMQVEDNMRDACGL